MTTAPDEMKLGVNLCFAIKRWLEPERLACIIRTDLDLTHVQYTWDLTDPWWPHAVRDRRAREYASAFRAEGLEIESTFGGIASYIYSHFLAPTEELRALGAEHLRRAIDMTAAMQVRTAGMPLGSYSAADAASSERREAIYQEALEAWFKLASHAKRSGLDSLLIEPVPIETEFPASAGDALRLMRDLDGQTDVPVRLLVDWGHATFEPLFAGEATMQHWMQTCGRYIDAFHIQQTDGQGDRHWSFTADGLVTGDILQAFWRDHSLTMQTLFLEIIYPFEATDEHVLQDMQAGLARLRHPRGSGAARRSIADAA